MKRLTVFLVFLTVLLPCFHSFAAAYTEGDWEYKIISYADKTIRISGYAPSGDIPEVLEVPETLGDYYVKEIGWLRNVYRKQANGDSERVPGPKILVLPAGLEKIDAGSIGFYDLEEIRIENGLNYETREGVLFESKTHTLLTYPRNRKEASYTVPEGTLAISREAFNFPEYLNEVVLPDSVRRIEKDAFVVSGLRLTIPKGIEKIEPGAVIYAREFVSFSPRYPVIDGLLVDAEEKALLSVPNYDSERGERNWIIHIPEGIETIEYHAINGINCYQAVFPSTLKTIKSGNDFYQIYSGSLVFPEGLESIGDFFSAVGLKTLTFPSTLRSIGNSCFSSLSSLESIFFGENLTSIGGDSFCRNRNLATVVLPPSLTAFGSDSSWRDQPFDQCPKLCAVVTPGSKAESYCREKMISYRYFFDRIWSVDPGEAEAAFSLSGADQVQIRMDKKSLELTYTLEASPHKDVFPAQWKNGLLCMENGNMNYTLTDASHLTIEMNGKELHLTRIEDRK